MNVIKKTCCFTGHRPKHFRFQTNDLDPECIRIKDFLKEQCERLIRENGVAHFISGGALGVDTWAMEAVVALKEKYPGITLECALPYAGLPDSFSPEDQQRYAKIKSHIDTVTELKKEYVRGCMEHRNKYLVDHAAYVIAVFIEDKKKSGTANTIRYAKKCRRTVLCLNVKA